MNYPWRYEGDEVIGPQGHRWVCKSESDAKARCSDFNLAWEQSGGPALQRAEEVIDALVAVIHVDDAESGTYKLLGPVESAVDQARGWLMDDAPGAATGGGE